jgi:hypothetical protein
VKDLASFSFSSLGQVTLRLGLKLVEATPGAKMELAAFVILYVALA